MSRDLFSFLVRHVAHTFTTRLGAAILVALAIPGTAQAQSTVSRFIAEQPDADRWTSGLVCQSVESEPGALFVETNTTAPTVHTLYLGTDGRFEPSVLASGDDWTIVQIDGPVQVCAVAWDDLPHSGLDLHLRPVPGGAWAVADPIEIDPDGAVADPIEIDPDGAVADPIEIDPDGAVADPIEIDPDGAVADPIEIDPDGYRIARSATW